MSHDDVRNPEGNEYVNRRMAALRNAWARMDADPAEAARIDELAQVTDDELRAVRDEQAQERMSTESASGQGSAASPAQVFRTAVPGTDMARAVADAGSGSSAADTWATLDWFPLPVPNRTAALAAANSAEGAPPVLQSESPDGAASFAVYERDDAGYWLEVSLAPGVPQPRIVVVRYAVAGEDPRQLLVPVGGGGGDLAVAVVRLPGYAPEDQDPAGWRVAGPLPPGDVPVWDRETVAASVDAAVNAVMLPAWRRLAALLPDGPRQLVTGVLDEDSE